MLLNTGESLGGSKNMGCLGQFEKLFLSACGNDVVAGVCWVTNIYIYPDKNNVGPYLNL